MVASAGNVLEMTATGRYLAQQNVKRVQGTVPYG